MLLEISETHSKPQVTKITLEWREGRNGNDAWNEICAWTMEQYGLPGTRYTWHPTEADMSFWFYNEKDAIHFMLRWA